jgi:hypothetical protein
MIKLKQPDPEKVLMLSIDALIYQYYDAQTENQRIDVSTRIFQTIESYKAQLDTRKYHAYVQNMLYGGKNVAQR